MLTGRPPPGFAELSCRNCAQPVWYDEDEARDGSNVQCPGCRVCTHVPASSRGGGAGAFSVTTNIHALPPNTTFTSSFQLITGPAPYPAHGPKQRPGRLTAAALTSSHSSASGSVSARSADPSASSRGARSARGVRDDDAASSSVPSSCRCPISHVVMKDPVSTASGSTFERSKIERWLRDHDTDPMTNLPLAHKRLAPDDAMRARIHALP